MRLDEEQIRDLLTVASFPVSGSAFFDEMFDRVMDEDQ